MTVLRRDPQHISNYFDRLLSGIGHRGSSYMDLDHFAHDGRTHRFLGIEFKQINERLDKAALIALEDLALEPRWTVWFMGRSEAGLVVWGDFRALKISIQTISEADCRERYEAWWENRYRLDRYVELAEELDPARTGARALAGART